MSGVEPGGWEFTFTVHPDRFAYADRAGAGRLHNQLVDLLNEHGYVAQASMAPRPAPEPEDWSPAGDPAGDCANCGKPIRRVTGPGFEVFDHPGEGNHTVCDWTLGMAPTNRVATPLHKADIALSTDQDCRVCGQPVHFDREAGQLVHGQEMPREVETVDLVAALRASVNAAKVRREHHPLDWFTRGAYVRCSCGYAPDDNVLANQHWAQHGIEWYDDHGQLKARTVQP